MVKYFCPFSFVIKRMKKGKRPIGVALLLLYIFFFASANLRSHVHIVDGITIVHSHFSKDTFPFSSTKTTHTHNSKEINLIHHFNNALFFIFFLATSLGLILFKPIKIGVEIQILIPLKVYLYNPCLRGPPVC